jgi:hypothetical protein
MDSGTVGKAMTLPAQRRRPARQTVSTLGKRDGIDQVRRHLTPPNMPLLIQPGP